LLIGVFYLIFVKMIKKIIAIDGWSACGKSTLAKQLANKLGYVYIDSGAMYRAITLFFLRQNINLSNAAEVLEALRNINIDFRLNTDSQHSDIYLNGENIEVLIRDLSVAGKVSNIAAIAAVRTFAVAQQQKMGNNKGIVMDGRDIGTTVFPNAEIKLFMTADSAIRVERRLKELTPKNPHITMEEVKKNLENRDHLDSTREISPLRKAADAIVLDNTHLTMDEQLEFALRLI
jgi:cytidylate kinase